jgi:hypothetical protein
MNTDGRLNGGLVITSLCRHPAHSHMELAGGIARQIEGESIQLINKIASLSRNAGPLTQAGPWKAQYNERNQYHRAL